MNISYLISSSTETTTLSNLLSRLEDNIDNKDEIVLLYDSEKGDSTPTKKILDNFISTTKKIVCPFVHPLGNSYSDHKNWGLSKCSHKYVFQIDGDELPTETLLQNIKPIIESNPSIELFWISRINAFKGVTPEHAKQWGWRLTESPTYKIPLVNWPDPQGRLLLNCPDRIKWVGRLHERIEGNTSYAYLPTDEDLALYHDKTIERQIETNLSYNKRFTQKENEGFVLPP